MPISSLLVSPITSPLFKPLLISIGAVLGIGFLAILFAVKRKGGKLGESSLFIRWRTWVFIAPIAIIAILSGPAALCGLTILMIWVALSEYASVTEISSEQAFCTKVFGTLLALVALLAPSYLILAVVAGLLSIGILCVCESDGKGFEKAALTVLGFIYIPLLGSHAILLDRIPGGAGLLLALITASAMSNVAAFTIGKIFGKHKMAPAVSPNKTWEGAFGTLLGAFAGFAIMSFAEPRLPMLVWVAIPYLITFFGIFGDLFESLMKRSFGVKDAAHWLPGFGGVMDRIDGLLFVMPAVYWFLVGMSPLSVVAK